MINVTEGGANVEWDEHAERFQAREKYHGQ